MTSAKAKMTDLEAKVAERVRMLRDPWDGTSGMAGVSGRVSGALGRLQRKGFVNYVFADGRHEYVLTPEGREVLDEHTKSGR